MIIAKQKVIVINITVERNRTFHIKTVLVVINRNVFIFVN